jgi:hypothetical protein
VAHACLASRRARRTDRVNRDLSAQKDTSGGVGSIRQA